MFFVWINRNNYSNEFCELLAKSLFEQQLIERWLEIHNQLLKNDLFDKSIREYDHIDDDFTNDSDSEDDFDLTKKPNQQQSATKLQAQKNSFNDTVTVNLQSKNLYQSLKMLLFTLNKSNIQFDLSIKRLNMNKIFKSLMQSKLQIINYLITENYSNQNAYFRFKNDELVKYLYSLSTTILVLFKSVTRWDIIWP